MAIAITPVDYETNFSDVKINNVAASIADMNPNPHNELVIDTSYEIQVKLAWDQVGTHPTMDGILVFVGATWQAKAVLHSVDGGASATQTATVLYTGGATPKEVVVSFPPNTLTPGTYQLFLSCNLMSTGLGHLGTAFVAQGRAIEIFDSAFV